MSITQVAFLGDSLTQGTQSSFAIATGGAGNWCELVSERLANILNLGPLLSSGLRGTWLGLLAGGDTEWVFSSGWNAVASTDAFDRIFGQGHYATGGSSQTATATLPSTSRAAVGFAVYWMNFSAGGNWQYSTDGGSTWTNMGQTIGGASANLLCKFYVSTPITPGNTVQFRAFDGSGNVGICLAGIEWFYSTAKTGLIVHNLGVNGWRLDNNTQSTSGDRLAFFDSVVLGTGSPISNSPNAGVINMNINDVVINNTTTWATDLTTLNTRVSPLGPVAFINPYETIAAIYPTSQQSAYRAQTKTTAAGFATPAKVLDLYDMWSANGITGNVASVSAGLVLASDGTHETQAGHFDIASRVYYFIRDQILPTKPLAAINPFTVGSTTISGPTKIGGSIPGAVSVGATQTQVLAASRSAAKNTSIVQTQTLVASRSAGKNASAAQTQMPSLVR